MKEVDDRSDTEKFGNPDRSKYKFNNVPLDDQRVWNLYCQGDVKGLFQVETDLGKQWCKKIKPKNIDELSALISLIRPGGLFSGFAEKYTNIKNGLEEPSYIHPALEPILGKTYSCLVFQESILRICIDIAGFNEIQADDARRAVGKKLPEEMDKVRKMFIEGAEKKGIVSKEIAEEIFGWIQKSVRYLFNACLTKESYVFTKNGIKSIVELEIGEEILAPSDHSANDEYTKVLQKYDNGEKEVFQIVLESGKIIEATLDHEFYCEDEIKRSLWEIISDNHKILCKDD